MTQIEPYLPWILVLVLSACAILLARWWKEKKHSNAENRFIRETLQAAINQRALFDLKLMDGEQHSGIAAVPLELSPNKLSLRAQDQVLKDCSGKSAQAYFRVGHDDSAVFYVFDAPILSSGPTADGNRIELGVPSRLMVEKKRHFLRVQPDPRDILMIGVWPMNPGQRLPRSNSDIGQPPISWKSGHTRKDICLDNISGAGIALTFAVDGPETTPGFDISPGRQLLCLLVCRTEKHVPTPLIFWSADEIKNLRRSPKSVTLGLEFTNVAIQEQGSPEIHWTHASPWRGVKPILQWVQRIDRFQH